MILKNKNGQVRLLWHFILLVASFLLAAYLLRLIPIRIQARILLARGLSVTAALKEARYLFLEDPLGMSIIGILQGLLWFVLIYVLVRTVGKQPCSLRDFGFSSQGRGLRYALLGISAGLLMYFGYFAIGILFNQNPFVWSPAKLGTLPFILVMLDLLANGFGEEAAFRAYWQKLLVDRHGLWLGIIIASASFVLLHLVIARLSIIELLAGIMLAGAFGILYVWTQSIFLVGAMHTTLNLSSRLLGPWPSDISLLAINGLCLVIVSILFLRFKHPSSGPLD